MKKFTALFIAIILCFSLCACGSKGDITTTTAESTATEARPQKIELNIPVGEAFTIVEATYTTKRLINDEVAVKLKIKNNTDTTFQGIDFQFYTYDKNGDRVGMMMDLVSDMEAGHSTWTSIISTDMTLSDFGSVRIESYKIIEEIDDTHIQAIDKVTLEPMPEVFFNQMTENNL